MKNIRTLIGSLLLALAMSAAAEDKLGFSVKGTQVETNLEYCVVGANGVGAPMVTFYDVISDNATGALTFYTHSNPTVITTAGTSTNLTCVGTGYASNDVLVVYQRASETYLRRQVYSSSATNIYLTATVTSSVGDVVTEHTANGAITIGDNTKQVAASGGVYFGTKGYPLLIELSGNGTNTVNINLVSGQYIR